MSKKGTKLYQVSGRFYVDFVQVVRSTSESAAKRKAREGYQNRSNGMKGSQENLSTVIVNREFGALTPQTSNLRLNPLWWTDLNASVTPWFPDKQPKHGEGSQKTYPTPRAFEGGVTKEIRGQD
jgi:hypothetical protein